jgi:hypothetical protein
MPDYVLYTDQAATEKATVIKTSLATSKYRLFKSPLIPTRFTTKDQLVAAECDFSGYTAGGYSVTAWLGPTNNPQGGALINTPSINVIGIQPEDPDPFVPNTVGGFWIEDTSGDVRLVGVFSPVRPIAVAGDGFIDVVAIVEGLNATPPIEG